MFYLVENEKIVGESVHEIQTPMEVIEADDLGIGMVRVEGEWVNDELEESVL